MSFSAVLVGTLRGRGRRAYVALPENASDVFGTRARFPVKARFNGVAYRGCVVPMGNGGFALQVNKAIRTQLRLGLGGAVDVSLMVDADPHSVDVPADLQDALDAAMLNAAFDAMPYGNRRGYARWIAGARKPETRRRRIGQAMEKIGAGQRRASSSAPCPRRSAQP
ncbi:MAG: YdeI/OmpD-associated family protein [Candidatus Dormibacteraeota bacterium]|nr:YdeI/OmpD-associated family protein [Candidatus Dormibacteraeota bacterium]